jgi:two-component system cell cycle sensor histidine kinase PleC
MGGLNVLVGGDVVAALDHQTAVMGELASGASLPAVLDSIVLALERMMPPSACSILLLDDEGALRHGAAPSLPTAYSAAIDGLEPGPLAGSCGTAVYSGVPVIAVDVMIDLRWERFRDLAAEHGLRACWSSPVRCRGEVVGTFAVYHAEPYEPTPRDEELVRRFSHLASLAVEHDRAGRERLARQEAELARQAAEGANRAKSQFVTAISHELRTPLQAITGFTESLQNLDLSPEQRREALEHIDEAATHILSIVDDVLDLARVEAGAMPIDVTTVDAREAIDSVLAIMAPVAARGSITLEIDGPSLAVRADRRRLRQVIINLVANAVRFSPEGRVVRVHSEAGEGSGIIHVVDEGPGIPAELLARLFVPFDRLGADAGREGGAGLGLVLARRLTEAMGGSLVLSSTVGVGTHVTVALATETPTA